MDMIKAISTHLFLYKPLTGETIDLIKRYNFEFIEIWAMKPHFAFDNINYLKELADIISSYGIKVITFHGPLYEDVSDAMKGKWLSLASKDQQLRRKTTDLFKMVVDAMEFFDCRTIVTHTGLSGDIDGKEMENLYYSLQEIFELHSGRSINIALENGVSSSSSINSILAFIERYSPSRTGTCFDTGHAFITGNFSEDLEAISQHLMTMHIHDNRGISDEHLLPFYGNIPWERMMEILSKNGYNGPFVYELRHRGDGNEEFFLSEVNRIHSKLIRIMDE